MEAVQTRSPQSSEVDEAPSSASVLSEFDPLAVPTVSTFDGVATSSDRSTRDAQTASQDADLIALGEEQLFSGTRTLQAGPHSTNGPGEAASSSHEPPHKANSSTVSEEQLKFLRSARAAFQSTLQGLLQHTPLASTSSQAATSSASMSTQPSRASDAASANFRSTYEAHTRLSGNATPTFAQMTQNMVAAASANLSPDEKMLAQNLTQLLSCIDRLTESTSLRSQIPEAREGSRLVGAVEEVQAAERDLLWGRIDDLSDQVRVLTRQRTAASPPDYGADRQDEVERLDDAASQTQPHWKEYAPSIASVELPQYTHDSEGTRPPAYLDETSSLESFGKEKEFAPDAKSAHAPQRSPSIDQRPRVASLSEKTRRDLDGVTQAIERLYIVSPQLANQRVDPDRRQLRERQLAKLGNAIERLSKGRFEDQRASPGLADEEAEKRAKDRLQRLNVDALDRLVDQIDRAASRTLADQRVELRGRGKDVLNASTVKEDFEPLSDEREARRREFILEHTGKGRLASQDAVLTKSARVIDVFPHSVEADAPISLQKFLETERDLPPPPSPLPERTGSPSKKMFSPFRTSFFGGSNDANKGAPSCGRRGSWDVRISESFPQATTARRGSYDSRMVEGMQSKRSSLHERKSKSTTPVTIHHVAEDFCNLASVTVTFWTSSSSSTSTADQDEWHLCSVDEQSVTVARVGDSATFKLDLPCRLPRQHAQVVSKGDTHQIKLKTVDASPTRMRHDLEITVPYSTTMLREHKPSAISCLNCDSRLVDLTTIDKYNALPSEHWAELLEAWMCHKDQELSDDLVAKGKGIRPRRDEALVGSSYVVLDSARVSQSELDPSIRDERSADNHVLRPIRCRACKSMVGFKDVAPGDDENGNTCVRLLKHAIRISSLDDSFPEVGVDAHVATALLELSQAHACHRFVLADHEQEQPHVYMWLFNPFIRICSSARRSGNDDSVHPHVSQAVKVMYLINAQATQSQFHELVADEQTSYDTILYPRAVIDKLCARLKESTTVYPTSQRSFNHFQVGFLERL
ncbi:hypothetical protein ACM66B_003787 [Microbotryomycetes sp. NB124-2]